ncbi:uncharacterized protein LOC135958691 [Calliphora vicina]|uniref:uncharacterized protein LOC135958691 n=1 Tax=Calliphora vicina TaxID=7373 RepID=UPI00325B7AF4
MKEKRTRGQNFSAQEEDFLVSLIENHIEIIETKKLDGYTSKQKNEAWESIQQEFSNQTDTYRTAKMLREKYENMKKKAKLIMASQKRGDYLENGEASCSCSQVRSVAINRLVDLLAMGASSMEHSFEGNSNEIITNEVVKRKVNKVKCKTEVLDDEVEDDTHQYEPIVQLTHTPEKQLTPPTNCPTFSTNSKRSPEQSVVVKNCRASNCDASDVRASKAQKTFYRNEEKRAAERHLWEKELNAKRQMWEEELKNKKIELLNLQIEKARYETQTVVTSNGYNQLSGYTLPKESSLHKPKIVAVSSESFPWQESAPATEMSQQQQQPYL